MAKKFSTARVALSTTISLTAYNRLAKKRAETGTPIGEYIDNLILDDSDVYVDTLDVIIKNLAFIEADLKRKKQQATKLYRRIVNIPKESENYVTISNRSSLWSAADETMLDAVLTALTNLKISFTKMNQMEQKLEEEFSALIKPTEKYKNY